MTDPYDEHHTEPTNEIIEADTNVYPLVVPHRPANIEPVSVDDDEGVSEVYPQADPVDDYEPDTTTEGLRRALDARTAGRRPIVSPWLRDKQELRYAVRWAARHTAHHAAYHSVRVPKYAAKTVYRSPVGVAKLAGHAWRWASDAEAGPLRQAAVKADDAKSYLQLSRQRNDRVKWRVLQLIALALTTVAAALALKFLTPTWAHWLSVAVIIGTLAVLGSSADKPLVDRGVVAVDRSPKLTADIVVVALRSLGIAEISRFLIRSPLGRELFPAPIVRDGPGWRATIDLPHGVTATDIIDRRDRLASGLRRPLGCVWPEAVRDEHEGRLVLWVGDQALSKTKQPAWPLLKSGKTDLFEPQPFATDQRGRWVPLRLMDTAGIVGSVPRMGKTFALRELALIAALDPRAELHLYDLKGTGDLSPLECVAHRYGVGDEDEQMDAMLADFQALQREYRRRTKVIRELPRDVCPENKVTPDLASRKSLGLWPIFLEVDECQIMFEHPEHGKEFEKIATDLIKRGPALGIVLYLATQRPDARSIPPGISANASIRMCLRVNGQVENDMVLGTSAYKNGIRATMFSFANDKGVLYLRGEASEAQIVRTVAGLDAVASEKVALRAKVTRENAGRLTGHAVGEAPKVSTATLLDDLAAALGTDKSAWSETVLERLADLRPDTYTGWTVEAFAAAVKPYGLTTRQLNRTVDGERINRRGITRAAVDKAIADRAERRQNDS